VPAWPNRDCTLACRKLTKLAIQSRSRGSLPYISSGLLPLPPEGTVMPEQKAHDLLQSRAGRKDESPLTGLSATSRLKPHRRILG
jgi:hypothetical protein